MAKQFFKDLPDTTTPLIASRINGLLDGEEAMGSIVVDDINGKNLFNKGTITNGYYKNAYGNPISNSSASYSEIIKVDTTKTYYVNKQISIVYYDNNQQPVGTLTGLFSGAFTPTNPYIVINLTTTDKDTLQLELGSTATTYAPYNQPVKITDVGVKENTTFYANDFKCKNLCNGINQTLYINSGVSNAVITSGNVGLYIKTNGGKYTISTTASQATYRVGCTANEPSSTSQTLYNGVNKDGTSNTITIDTTGYNYLCITCTDLSKIQIEVGDTATTYTPYKAFENNELYSTSEIKIGTWVDSKPIYRIVKQLTTPSTAMTEGTLAENVLSNCDTLVNITGIINSGTNQWKINQQYDPTGATTNYYACIYYNKSTNKVNGRVGSSLTSKPVNIILEYTKTTD